jgi:glycosyltransferase involved in cell wall biosynthesis
MYNWVIDGLQRANVRYKVIEGKPLTRGVETGEVLDAEGTNYYKASQLMEICQLFKYNEIKNGDTFFIADLWFPGIETIRYIEAQRRMQVNIAGVHYAGVFDKHDFVHKMKHWAMYNELGWLKLANWIFVGSEYHKSLIVQGMYDNGIQDAQYKIYATGLVWDAEYVKSDVKRKERQVIFPHRTDMEKNPKDFFTLADIMRQTDEGVKFVITSSRKHLSSNIQNFEIPYYITYKCGLTKQEYYDELARSKVLFSSAHQETFGYALNEGLQLGCIPICPNRLSYPEVVEHDERLLYDSISEAVVKVKAALEADWDIRYYTNKYSKNIDRMLEIMEVDK